LALLLGGVQGCSCDGNPGAGNGDAGGDDQGVNTDGNPGAGDGSMVACISDLSSITLSPANSNVALDGTGAAPITFTATGMFSDGHSATLDPTQLAWSATRGDDTPPGMIANGVFQPNPSAGGTVTITVSDGCGHSGSTTVSFTLSVSIGTPSNPASWTGTPISTGTLPTVVYPSDQTRFPRNIYRTLFQWRIGGAYTQFRLTFTGPGSTVTVYTDGTHALCAGKTPAAGCWEADETAWSYIAASNAGQTVTWTVDALDTTTATPTVRRAAPITLGFSKRDVAGAIFYWSTTSAGVRRANISAAVPEDYITGKPATTYTNPTNTVQCVACHTVSRDGKYLLAPVQASSGQSLWITQVTPTPPPTPLVTSIANTGGHGFATISPDDVTVVASWNGKLWPVDRATGVASPNIALGALMNGTMPDWSPDNTQLVFSTGSGDGPSGASLAVIPYNNGTWGAARSIVAANTLSNLFPSFSPDGKWIAYSRGKGGHGDLTAQLNVVAQDGTGPIQLTNADCMVNNTNTMNAVPPKNTSCLTENNQPTWAPPGDLYWVAFNSQRAYGVVTQPGTQQIWVAAVDPNKLGGGMDPSYPAFRLQFQGLNENNHRAFWTMDIRDNLPADGGVPPDMSMPPGDMAHMCIANGATCDPVNDTCCGSASGYVCDTQDNGVTYTCFQPPIP
jgi:Tol biopolymer transport system component